MNKIKELINRFINKYIVSEDPCCEQEGRYSKDECWEEGRIYERNPDTMEIRSRKIGEYGDERNEKSPLPKKKRGRPKKKK